MNFGLLDCKDFDLLWFGIQDYGVWDYSFLGRDWQQDWGCVVCLRASLLSLLDMAALGHYSPSQDHTVRQLSHPIWIRFFSVKQNTLHLVAYNNTVILVIVRQSAPNHQEHTTWLAC